MPLFASQALSMDYDDIQAVHGLFGSACYIDDSFPVVLYLAGKVRCFTNLSISFCDLSVLPVYFQ